MKGSRGRRWLWVAAALACALGMALAGCPRSGPDRRSVPPASAEATPERPLPGPDVPVEPQVVPPAAAPALVCPDPAVIARSLRVPDGAECGAVEQGGVDVRVCVAPVLPQRPGSELRARRGDHGRFFEVWFERTGCGRIGTDRVDDPWRPPLADVCLSDRFFVDVAGSPLRDELQFPKTLAEQLTLALRREQLAPTWFDAPRVERPAADFGQRLRVADSALPDLVYRLRKSATAIAERGDGELLVGRVCQLPAGGIAEAATEPMLNWHLWRMGIERGSLTSLFGRVEKPLVDVALIDGGVDPRVVPGVVVHPSPLDEQPLHAHGTAMADLIRSLAPRKAVEIHSYRVFDAQGTATTIDVARAIDEALFGAGRLADEVRGRPLVINLSLGWPPELEWRRLLRGRHGSTDPIYEDGVGGPVRAALERAREVNRELRPVIVVAAAGNRPGRPAVTNTAYRKAFGAKRPPLDLCGAREEPAWFYPAEWARPADCLERLAGEALPLVAVGGVDASPEERATVVSIRAPEPPLVAPGQLVYARIPLSAGPPVLPTAPAPAHAAAIAGKPIPVAAEHHAALVPLRPRMAFTGTSVAAALTSGTAAVVQAARRRENKPPLAWRTLERLLYASGADLARTTDRAAPVRRVSVCRALHALRCEALLSCLAGVPAGVLPPGALVTCARDALRCWKATTCEAPEVKGAPGWPDSFSASAEWQEFPVATSSGEAAAAVEECSGSAPFDHELRPSGAVALDWYAAGDIGPQPHYPGCPDCRLVASLPTSLITLEMPLNPLLGKDVRFKAPYLVVTSASGKVSQVDLSVYSKVAEWRAGMLVTVKGIPMAGTLPRTSSEWTTASASLVVQIYDVAETDSWRDDSPHRITVK